MARLCWNGSSACDRRNIDETLAVVEDHLELDIGIKTDWPEENIPAYLAMLVEEINERTEFDLLLHLGRSMEMRN